MLTTELKRQHVYNEWIDWDILYPLLYHKILHTYACLYEKYSEFLVSPPSKASLTQVLLYFEFPKSFLTCPGFLNSYHPTPFDHSPLVVNIPQVHKNLIWLFRWGMTRTMDNGVLFILPWTLTLLLKQPNNPPLFYSLFHNVTLFYVLSTKLQVFFKPALYHLVLIKKKNLTSSQDLTFYPVEFHLIDFGP